MEQQENSSPSQILKKDLSENDQSSSKESESGSCTGLEPRQETSQKSSLSLERRWLASTPQAAHSGYSGSPNHHSVSSPTVRPSTQAMPKGSSYLRRSQLYTSYYQSSFLSSQESPYQLRHSHPQQVPSMLPSMPQHPTLQSQQETSDLYQSLQDHESQIQPSPLVKMEEQPYFSQTQEMQLTNLPGITMETESTLLPSSGHLAVPLEGLAVPHKHLAAPQGHFPAPQGHFPAPQGHFPAPQGHFPAPQGHLPALQGHFPAPQGHFPAPQGHLPAPQGHLPVPQGHLPDPQQHFTGPLGDLPVPQGHLSVPHEYLSATQGHLPAPQGHLADTLAISQGHLSVPHEHLTAPQEYPTASQMTAYQGHLITHDGNLTTLQENLATLQEHLTAPQEHLDDPMEDLVVSQGHLMPPWKI
ncbi:uncharacterized protein LOC103106297 [Monodelphis domestica]|uniref:uncharacterized protein LOC103106297 n=1 Tax=Monodelphis domestica TaxID=13616 RepID=UPI0004432988|nr:uncharacterized protein LOC103106297 [Monodelphis domestica]